ncbi:EscU/YscU/HrcU family type III secretion system export apparatus switch protein [Cupriavidus gilardii]|uniref:EscU/YscU/HrcU family type III secretion system export apparatus switch protein n=1 Tax=Cupriavidus gilardii TaxID=82541 RepID=UPI001EE547A7|nr:EscU/YscU/HrcU family type III secretion system export apparatus switch protein [Cupriavidus gilardii]MCG5258904.1 EscU/YscU/HrcU family type III secretion system export apparatus switch protein [Cupriavidus gilardii]MDF9429067.1 EscU/YscU/HrcU family type III secretion system export apparatus switch protein [Cupriavidus gilardii]
MTEKTEQPTPKKIRDAREEGQIAKSVEIATGIQLAVLLGYFWLRGEDIIDAFQSIIEVAIASIGEPLRVAMGRVVTVTGTLMLHLLAPVGIVLILATVGSVMAQIGPLFAPKFIKPKGERISPLTNAKQLFSLRSLFEFGKSLLKVSILSIAFYLLIKRYLYSFQFLPLCGTECGLRVTGVLIGWLWGILVLFYVVFAIADLAFQKRTLTKQLMMSRDEIQKEFKNTEGDPHIKHKRKEIHRDIQSGSMAANVKRSTAVVRNPTHVAVCLYFVAGETPLPQVIEKGIDARARRMIAIAEEAGVPMVEEVHVARRLYARTEVGDYIPAELFEPVAEILNLVNEMKQSDEGIEDAETDADDDAEEIETGSDDGADDHNGNVSNNVGDNVSDNLGDNLGDTEAEDTETDNDIDSDSDAAGTRPARGGVDPRGGSGRGPRTDPRRPADG